MVDQMVARMAGQKVSQTAEPMVARSDRLKAERTAALTEQRWVVLMAASSAEHSAESMAA